MKQRTTAFVLFSTALQFTILAAAPAVAAEKATPETVYFLVQVQKEQFVLAVTQPRAIRDAVDCVEGRKRLIPTGEVAKDEG